MLAERTVGIARRHWPEGDPRVGMMMQQLGNSYRELGRAAELECADYFRTYPAPLPMHKIPKWCDDDSDSI